MELLDAPFLTVVVAHMDDESLFCGGLLLERGIIGRQSYRRTDVVACTSPADCNRRIDPDENMRQSQNKIRAFHSVGVASNASAFKMCFLHESNWKLCLRGDAILTHGPSGEYGHQQHIRVHEAVASACPTFWTFATFGESVSFDWEEKKKLLEYYRYGCTRTPEWTPWTNPAYAPWCCGTEYFQKVTQ